MSLDWELREERGLCSWPHLPGVELVSSSAGKEREWEITGYGSNAQTLPILTEF